MGIRITNPDKEQTCRRPCEHCRRVMRVNSQFDYYCCYRSLIRHPRSYYNGCGRPRNPERAADAGDPRSLRWGLPIARPTRLCAPAHIWTNSGTIICMAARRLRSLRFAFHTRDAAGRITCPHLITPLELSRGWRSSARALRGRRGDIALLCSAALKISMRSRN